MTGKWHLGQQHGTPPWKRGFDRSLNLQAGGVYFHNQTGSKAGAKLFLNGAEKPMNDPQFGEWYGTFLWSQWGLKFVDEAIAAKQPFFLYLAHCAPHFPADGAGGRHRQVSRQVSWRVGTGCARPGIASRSRLGSSMRNGRSRRAAPNSPAWNEPEREQKAVRRHDGDLRGDDRHDGPQRRHARRRTATSAGNSTTR